MKIQLLSFPGCPNAERTRARLREAMQRAGVAVAVEEVDVTDPGTADHLRGWASPTVLIDGADVGGQAAPDGGGCRLYPGGAPEVDAIERGLRAAAVPGARRETRARGLLGGGALLVALAASACCLGPAALAVLGLSGAGLSALLAPWRPLFLALTVVLVAAGAYLAFRRTPSLADDCGCAASPRRPAGRWMMAAVAVIALGVAAYPWLAGGPGPSSRGAAPLEKATATAELAIDGITCASCAGDIVTRLAGVPGVASASVDLERDTAIVTYDPVLTSPAALAAAVSAMPQFEARPLGAGQPQPSDQADPAPAGTALVDLNGSLEGLRVAFDGRKGRNRFIALLSPT